MNVRIERRLLAALTLRVAVFAALWWMVTEAAPGSWSVGASAVLAAAVISLACIPPTPLAWLELLRFVPFFIMHSLLGGLDVARCALHPGLPIAPAIVRYRLRLPPGLPRIFMVNTTSLLPGTLSADLDGDHLLVHALDGRKDCRGELDMLERRIARLFAIPLTAHREGG